MRIFQVDEWSEAMPRTGSSPDLFLDRLPMLVEIRTENNHREIICSNARDPSKDRKGGASSMLRLDLRFFGIADYLLKNDRESFRRQLSESARITVSLLERHDSGEPISDAYVGMITYRRCSMHWPRATCIPPIHWQQEWEDGTSWSVNMIIRSITRWVTP